MSTSTNDDDLFNGHADDDCCWPFTCDVGAPDPILRRQHLTLGKVYSVALVHPTDIAKRRPGESQTERQSRALGKLRIISHNNNNTTILCWYRFKIWWMQPRHCPLEEIPPGTIAMLFKDNEDRYRLVMPLLSSLSASLHRRTENGSFVLRGEGKRVDMYCGVGDDPFALLREGVLTACHDTIQDESFLHKNTMPPRTTLQGLGWCTWNAFYTQITGPQLVEAVEFLTARKQIPLRWMILDDGWQHTTGDDAANGEQWSQRLVSHKESPDKFQQMSLKQVISKIHQLSSVEDVWVWHTLTGYWLGLDTTNFSGTLLCYPHFPSGVMDNDKSASKEASVELGIGVPDPPEAFFDGYHSYLRECGVSGVKVDAQAVLGILRPCLWNQPYPVDNETHDNSLATALHKALAESAHKHFSRSSLVRTADRETVPAVIHCMAHAPEIILQLSKHYPRALPLMRASDDHYPDNRSSHGPHIVACAFNSLLLSHVSVPDWDMLTTTDTKDERIVRLHAVSRCLSGGPIYVSDPPLTIRKDVVDWICCSNGRTLPCREAALPLPRCLLSDPLDLNAEPLVLFNSNGRSLSITSAVLGIYHLAGTGRWDCQSLDYVPTQLPAVCDTKKVVLRPKDIPILHNLPQGTILAMPFFASDQCVLLDSASFEFSLDMRPMDCDAVSLIPVRNHEGYEIAVLGLMGKINAAGAVQDLHLEAETFIMDVLGCGTFLVAVRHIGIDVPVQFEVNGSPVRHQKFVNENDANGTYVPVGILKAGFRILAINLEPGSIDEQQISIIFGDTNTSKTQLPS